MGDVYDLPWSENTLCLILFVKKTNTPEDSLGCMQGQVTLPVYLISAISFSPAIVVWIYDASANNLRIDNDFRKYFKESCWLCTD